MRRVVLITHEPIAASMAGPAIRVLEMARALTEVAAPVIATPYPLARALPPGVHAEVYAFADPSTLRRIVDGADVVLIQGFTLYKFPFLTELATPIVVDLYCPFQFENLERMRRDRTAPAHAAAASDVDRQVLLSQIERGDFFLCANERQRDFWLGMFYALGRLSPALYADDPEARNIIAVAPFGLSDQPPVRTRPIFKGAIPGIAETDRLIVWGGSVLEWQDPVLVVEAMRSVARAVPTARLALPGGPHPNPEVPLMPVLARARERAAADGLLDTHVFFTPWVPYDDRGGYLLEADIGVSAHRMSLETRYAWRTRMLDYVWAQAPIVCSAGDAFADLVASRGLGAAVPVGDVDGFAHAIIELLTDDDRRKACAARLETFGRELQWRRAVEPLLTFVASPRRIPPPPARAASPSATATAPSTIDRVIRRARRVFQASRPN